MPLRDIRPDLRERLAEVESERKLLDDRERSLRALLADEERRWDRPEHPDLFDRERPEEQRAKSRRIREPSDNTRFLLDTLVDDKTWSIDEIAQAAEAKGLDFDGKSAKKVLNFVLLNLRQKRLVEMVDEAHWRRVLPIGGNDATAG